MGNVGVCTLLEVSSGEDNFVVIHFDKISDSLVLDSEIVRLSVCRKIDAVYVVGKCLDRTLIHTVVKMAVDEENVRIFCENISDLL